MTKEQALVMLLARIIRDNDLTTAHAFCAVILAMIPVEDRDVLVAALKLAAQHRLEALPGDAELALRAFQPGGLAN